MPTRLLTGMLAACFAFTVHAESQLAQQINEAGVGWMIGQWAGQTKNGDTVHLSFKWDLAKNVVLLSIKTPEWSARGMSVANPMSEEPIYHGIDNRGVVADGKWSGEYGSATLTYQYQKPDGETGRMGVVYSQAADGAMKIGLHKVGSDGELQYPAFATMQLHKKK